MTDIARSCPRCSRTTPASVSQSIRGGNRLVWSQSLSCESCGFNAEYDDIGLPPEEYRKALLRADGTWGLHCSLASERIQISAVLRAVLGLEMGEAISRTRNMPGFVWHGTEREVEWLLAHMERNGLSASKIRDSPSRG